MSRVILATHPQLFARRRVVRGLAGALLLSPLTGLRAQTRAGAAPDNRSLSFVHTHTGEKLSVNYLCDGAFQAQCIAPLNHFLRDFRSNEVAAIDPQLLDILFELQVHANRDAVYEVISGYRSAQTNEMLSERSTGVAKHSLHMEGKAIDIRLSGFSTKKLHQLALSSQQGGVGYYAKSDFVHLDTGRVRTWVG